VIENFTNPEKFVYHYTTAETALNWILPRRKLKLGRYADTNDPKESKTWWFDLGTNEHADLGQYNMDELAGWLDVKLKAGARVLCCSTDTAPLTGDHMQDIFNRGYCKPRMWSQYGGAHSGVCLVLDKADLSKAIDVDLGDEFTRVEGPIQYRNRSILSDLRDPDDQQYTINVDHLERVGRDNYPGDHFYSHYKRLFFENMCDWSAECEWRYIVFSETDRDAFVSIEKCLRGVIFGDLAAADTIDNVMRETGDLPISYMGLKWKNCSPWYDYQNLKYVFGPGGSGS